MARMVSGFSDRKMTIREWSRSHFNVWKLLEDTITKRLKAGYSLEAALSLPPRMTQKFRHPDRDVRRIARNHFLSRKALSAICGRTVEEIRRIVGNES
jgi:hypothetical protein